MQEEKTAVTVCLLTDFNDQGGAACRFVSRGRGVLRFFLGDHESRQRLFGNHVLGDRVLVASVDGRMAGYLTFQFDGRGPYVPDLVDFVECFGSISGRWRWWLFRFFERRTEHAGFYIYGLSVSRKARRRGVASALMAEAETRAEALGADAVFLEVHRENLAALRLYSSRKFLPVRFYDFGFVPSLFSLYGYMCLRKSIIQ